MLQTGGVLEVLISIEVLTIVLKRMKTILSVKRDKFAIWVLHEETWQFHFERSFCINYLQLVISSNKIGNCRLNDSNHFMALVSFYAPLKTSGYLWFSDAFQKVQKEISAYRPQNLKVTIRPLPYHCHTF